MASTRDEPASQNDELPSSFSLQRRTRELNEEIVPIGDLPHVIPGPVGSTIGTTRKKNRFYPLYFNCSAWHCLLNMYHVHPYGPNLLTSSIASIKNSCLRNEKRFFKLAARVKTATPIMGTMHVVLEDCTGEIPVTIEDGSANDTQPFIIEAGDTIMLDNINAFMYCSGNYSYHAHLDKGFYVGAQKANIAKVIHTSEHISFNKKYLGVAYTPDALQKVELTSEMLRELRLFNVE